MRYFLTLMLISALAFVIACQSAAAPKSVKKIEEQPDTKAPVAKQDNHDEHDHGEEAARISLEDAKTAYDAGEAVFVDTRSEMSYKTEHVKGAINIPASDFENRYKSIPKDKKIITYCSWPNENTSARVAQMLMDKGFENTYALVGGTAAWKNAGYPMESGSDKE